MPLDFGGFVSRRLTLIVLGVAPLLMGFLGVTFFRLLVLLVFFLLMVLPFCVGVMIYLRDSMIVAIPAINSPIDICDSAVIVLDSRSSLKGLSSSSSFSMNCLYNSFMSFLSFMLLIGNEIRVDMIAPASMYCAHSIKHVFTGVSFPVIVIVNPIAIADMDSIDLSTICEFESILLSSSLVSSKYIS